MDVAIVDKRADEKTIYSLEKAGLYVIPTTVINGLYDSVATHADMQIHYLGSNKFICAPETFLHYKKLLPDEFTLLTGSVQVGSEYPHDIAYNAAALKDFVICNAAYTAIEILSEYKCMNKNILNVKQGYSKCNTAIVTGNSIITSDIGIYKKSVENEINVLKITSGNIKLRGMEYGFIGGATGLIAENVLGVNGNIHTHIDSDEIKTFCSKRNVEIVPLKDGILEDIGTIITNIHL